MGENKHGPKCTSEETLPSMPYKVDVMLMEITRMLHQRGRVHMESIGLHRGQGYMLKILEENPGIHQSELAALMRMKPPTISVALQRMEVAGLIERKSDDVDMRRISIYITPKATALNEASKQFFSKIEAELLQGLSEGEGEQLRSLLRRVWENMAGQE